MAAIAMDPLLQNPRLLSRPARLLLKPSSSFASSMSKLRNRNQLLPRSNISFCTSKSRRKFHTVIASSTDTALAETFETAEDVVFKETFPVKRTEKVEGKIFVRLDQVKDQQNWQLTVGCSLPGKWILHWGVSFIDDCGSEWDQPPEEMRPPGSVPIKDYAIETPLKKASKEDAFYEVKIDFSPSSAIAAIQFVLKDEETGAWYQHKGRDFKVPLVDCLEDDGNMVGSKKSSGAVQQLSNTIIKSEESDSNGQANGSESIVPKKDIRQLEGFYEEQHATKEIAYGNLVSVAVKKCPETGKNVICLETDIPGDVVLHWGVCRDIAKRWEIPPGPQPPETTEFKNKALRTLLQAKGSGSGSSGTFAIDQEFMGFLFVLKLNDDTWLKFQENDFYIPLSQSSTVQDQQGQSDNAKMSKEIAEENEDVSPKVYTDGIISEIRNLVTGLSAEKGRKTKTKEAQETILQEIEKLAAEAYSIFRSSVPTFSEEALVEAEAPLKIRSATGTGFEILCQGFNWESHKSGKWYMEIKEKAAEISSLGFTVIWLPPPTDSVSPEGYMPRDLYNLNSRYGTIDELKELVKTLHGAGLKVLGDAVLNHRCAQYQNQNGVWNIFGGRLNWDDRAVVADDPHFQGRGNKSSGESFHAAPNIDHSQDFVRKDINEWLCWLRHEIGYDGWRLDFVRGFWGGYVKDYMGETEPYFSVGEFWDSLKYTYDEMDYDQDAHRQRIVDWINATGGTCGAFDVTTKGILHGALERCEYWRLSDKKGKPPGVVGWWPSRAVTFIENHDTGSTQGHWRFPGGKEMQGYAYILTHPGTPAVFFDHIFSHYQSEIATLISLRNRNEINCRSTVNIVKAERDVYAAIIDEKVAMKIGPGHFEPQNGSQNWSFVAEGRDYKLWEAR